MHTQLTELAEMLCFANNVLLHGDVSPKNILFHATGPVFLDAECATMGDASFDPAFCLNHLVLKAIHLPTARERLLNNITAFFSAYSKHLNFGNSLEIEVRVARLLPALMLARVDGKSPVEYLAEKDRKAVRKLATELILSPETTIASVVSRIGDRLV
ncbi:phosphotransferase [Falsihalocynthiibacter sp. SS001]|uniref:phosphotransferase n=1 Tax=Falsihalocynthiibacter sp. SS001 TaxID=3349698 RepID=UPI0036D3DD67